ncbi:MAG: helix-turn-helix domain-containing protein [Alphaproteobacteria bacterium]
MTLRKNGDIISALDNGWVWKDLPMDAMLPQAGCDAGCGRSNAAASVEHCKACPVRDLAVCSSLTDDEIVHLAKFVDGQELPTGAEIFAEGDLSHSVYTLTKGVIKTHKLMPDGRRQVTGFFFGGDFVGLAHGEECAYTAEAVGPVQVCRFDRAKFESVLEEFPQTRQRLLTDASAELAAAHNQMVLLGRKTAREKVATFLLMVDEHTARWRDDPDVLDLPMTRTDIADYLGLTTETVSRTLTQLRSEKLIAAVGSQNVRLLDRDALEDMADG